MPALIILALCLVIPSFPSNAAPPRDASINARLASCDSAIVRAAVDEMLRDPKVLQEPLTLFHAALGERAAGRKEEAAFLYLAARLRTSRQILFEKGDRPQLLAIMVMTVAPLIMPVLESDSELARRVVKRVIDWDRSMPDPFRGREAARSGNIPEKLAEIDAGLARLPDQIRDDPTRVAKARDAEQQAERQIKTTRAERCAPGTRDPVNTETATKHIKTGTAGLKPFDFGAETKAQETVAQKPICDFPGLKLPAEFSVFAAGAYSGRNISFQIDQSGHEGTQIDVAVNSPNKPVVLMLGAYEPTIWNIGWSKETKILAVLVGGYHRQVVAGLEKGTPLLISSYNNRGACGYFYVTPDNLAPLNPLSKRVFGRPVDMVFPATKGKVVVGEPIPAGAALVTSAETTPESFYDKTAPIAGPAGLEDAVRKGLLRKAGAADAEAWSDAIVQNSPQRDIPPVTGQGIPKPPKPPIYNTYVVLKPFTYPSGLYGGNSATFLIPKGVPKPGGNPGHSAVYDFNTLSCQGALCSVR